MATTSIPLVATASFGNPLWRTAATSPLTNAQIASNIITTTQVYKVSVTQSAEMLLPFQSVSLTAFITSLQVVITTAVQSGAANQPILVSIGVLTNGTYQYTQSQALTIGAINTLSFPTKPDGTAWATADIPNSILKIIDQSTSGLTNLASLAINAISTTIPAVTITPIATITSSTPQVTWSYSDGDLSLQSGYQIQIINLTTNATVYDSGFIIGPDTAYTISANPLVPNNTNATTTFNVVNGTSGGTWTAVATSSDGTKVYAVGANGIYVSTNSGATFSLSAGTNSYSWVDVACSADGTKVYAVASNLVSNVYVSTNSGLSFFTSGVTGAGLLYCIACSSDGSKVFIGGLNAIATSLNFGFSFTVTSPTLATYTTIACSADGTKIYVGSSSGLFYANTGAGFVGVSISSNGLTSVNDLACSADGTKVYAVAQEIITSTNAGPNGAVNSIGIQTDGKIVIGGVFTTYDGISSNRIARITNAGFLDTTFMTNIGTGANGAINAVTIQPSDGKILLGGYFTSFNGTSVNRIIRLNTDGTIDSTFTTNIGTAANAVINTIAVQSNNSIVIGGSFTSFNSIFVNRIARLLNTGILDTSFIALGFTWTAQTMPNTFLWSAIAWNGTVFCAIVNGSTAAATSPDGITWTLRTLPSSQNWISVAWNGTVFCAVANGTTTAATSPDGITWTAQTMPSSQNWGAIAWNGTVFCAIVNGSTAAATSPTGVTWTAQTLPSSQNWCAIAWNGTVFCAIAFSGVAATSPTGVTWTAQTMPSLISWGAIAWNGTVFCAVAFGTTAAATSPDGITWTARTLPSSQNWYAIAWNGTVFCAVSGGTTNSTAAATSPDGITWTARTLPSNSHWTAIAWNGVNFCAIAGNNVSSNVAAIIPGNPLGATDTVNTIVIQSFDQKIIVGGVFNTFNNVNAYAFTRLNTDGTTDGTFLPSLGAGVIYSVNAMAVQFLDNKIIIGGLFYTPFSTFTTNALRLNTNGTTDTTFETNIGTNVNSQINAISIQSLDNKIVLAGGFTTFNSTATYPIVRLNTDGTTDTAFNAKIGTSINDEARTLAIQTDGRIIVGGNFTSFNGITANQIVRIGNDGTRDLTFIGRNAIWISTNSATSFSIVSSTYGIPFNSVVCSNDGVNIYASAYNLTGISLNGVYVSTNSGATFSLVSGTSGISWSDLSCTYNSGTVYGTANVGSVWTLVNLPQYKYQVRVSKNINGLNNFTNYFSFTPTSTNFNDTIPTVTITLQANKPVLFITLPDVTGLGYATRSVVILRSWSNGYGIIRNGVISNVGLTSTSISINDFETPTGVTVSYQVKALYFDASNNEYVGSPVSTSIAVPFNSKWTIQKCDGADAGISINTLLAGGLGLSRTRPQTHQYPLGSRYPITTSGTVQGYNGDLTIYFDNQPAFIAFMPYVDYIGKLLITAPNGAYKYITLDKNDINKSFSRGTDILRELKLNYTEEDSGLGFNEPTLYEF